MQKALGNRRCGNLATLGVTELEVRTSWFQINWAWPRLRIGCEKLANRICFVNFRMPMFVESKMVAGLIN